MIIEGDINFKWTNEYEKNIRELQIKFIRKRVFFM